jgi:hypothetical protein
VGFGETRKVPLDSHDCCNFMQISLLRAALLFSQINVNIGHEMTTLTRACLAYR